MSRLEEIKNNFYPYDGNFGLSPDDVKYLVQQSERVEELEKENDNYRKACSAWEAVESYGRKENHRYKQALEELRSYAINLPIEREEDGSPIPDEEGQLIYEITNQALEGDSDE